MLKAFKKILVNCIKYLQKVLKNIYGYIKKLSKGNVSQKIEVKDSETPTFVQVELEQENTLQVLENNSTVQVESINNHIPILQYNNSLSNYRINGEISSIEKSSRRRKYRNISDILKNHGYSYDNIEKIFGINDNIFNKIKKDPELLKVALQNSLTVDDIISIYSQSTTKLKTIKSMLEKSTNNKSAVDSILAYFERKIGPIVQKEYRQKCNLNYLLKDISKESPMPSLQQICIENLIRNADVQKNVFL